MLDINIVADYICHFLLSLDQSPTPLQLQKLLYYVQAWHLAFYKTALFEGKFQAWAHGPVNVEIYNRYKDQKSIFSLIESEDISGDFDSLSEENRYHIEAVLESYGHLSGTQLEELSHREAPWLKARGNLGPYARSNKEISENDMMNFYGRMKEPDVSNAS
ncbi:MAG: Panacea domain-containing protein [Thainema sp.]